MERVMSLQDLQTADPKAHTANIKKAICDLVQHLRRDIDKVEEPKAQALFETSAEVLQGLVTAPAKGILAPICQCVRSGSLGATMTKTLRYPEVTENIRKAEG